MKTYTSITEIPPQEKGWEAVVSVVEMTAPLHSRSGSTIYQHYIFQDDQGARVRGVTLNQDVKGIGSKLKVNKKYKVANAEVSKVKDEFVRDGITTQWMLKKSCTVEELTATATCSQINYHFTPIPDLKKFLGDKTVYLDVIGVPVDCTPARDIMTGFGATSLQKFTTMVDSRFHAVTLALWGENATEYGVILEKMIREFPIVICRKVQVGYYNGVEISSNKASTIIINPEIPESDELRTWACHSANAIQHVRDQDFSSQLSESARYETRNYVQIADATPQGMRPEIVWVKGTLNLSRSVQSYWYIARKKCNKSSPCHLDEHYKCNDCGHEQIATPIYTSCD